MNEETHYMTNEEKRLIMNAKTMDQFFLTLYSKYKKLGNSSAHLLANLFKERVISSVKGLDI